MGKPDAPDPVATAAGQTSSNIGTAIADQSLNMVNQVTPDGSLTYNQTGTTQYTDPLSGQVYDLPQYTATQELSESGQAIKNSSDQASINLSDFASEQSGRLNGLLADPVDLSNEAVEQRLFDLGSARLDPKFDQDRESLATSLSNQGIKLGSAAYDRAMNNFGQQENDAYNQLMLDGRNQSVQEILAERNQPINEITALLSGSQVSQPNFVGTPQTNVANTDYAGLVNSAYQADMANYNSIMGGLFGLGGDLIMSDERVKENVKKVGETKDGQNLYTYNYKGDDQPQFGLIAQEVEKKNPDAVAEVNGLKMVNYGKALS